MMDQDSTVSGNKKGGPAESAAVPPGKDTAPREAPAEGLKKEYVVDIFRDWCKGCGICAEFCPKKCIHMNAAGQPVVDKAGSCTGCGWCEIHCPDFAICVRELAARQEVEESD